MKPLPMPLRLAAGLVATAIEEAQELPRKLVELPVTAVSQVLQASMRMQQRVTELAIKGDQALGGLRPVPETPTWARFDEDELDSPYGDDGPFGGGAGHAFSASADHPFGGGVDRAYGGGNGAAGGASDSGWNVPPPRTAPRTVSPIRIARDPEPGGSATFDDDDEFSDLDFTAARDTVSDKGSPATAPAASEPVTRAPARPASPKPPTKPASKPAAAKASTKSAAKPAASKSATKSTRAPKDTGSAKDTAAKDSAAKDTATKDSATKDSKAAKAGAPAAQTGPKGYEDYPTWTLPQLRGRFRSLELNDVKALLTWETSHLDRPPYVTMLSNRIASITGR